MQCLINITIMLTVVAKQLFGADDHHASASGQQR